MAYSYLITIAYDGSNFAGWAKQPQQFTVQGYIENILSKTFQQNINILSSSRTDKGVHACQQKFTCRLPVFLKKNLLKSILTHSCKEYIVVKNVRSITEKFHPIKDVIKKEYRYYINTGKYNLFAKKYRWEYNLPIELSKFNQILSVFQGQHDFFNFAYCRFRDKAKTATVRSIDYIKSWRTKDNLLLVRIIARSFLRYQIRAIIGEAINCYKKQSSSVELLKKRLVDTSQPHNKYKYLAPAGGLYLWKIDYSKKR